MIANKSAIEDILGLLKNGYRRTPAGYKRSQVRTSSFELVYDAQGIRVRDRWRGYDLLLWIPLGHRLLINTDRTSAYYHDDIWRWLAEWEMEAVPVSFGAARLAHIDMTTIESVVYQPGWRSERKSTTPEDTPSWIRRLPYRYYSDTGRWEVREKKPNTDGLFHWTRDVRLGLPEAVFQARYHRAGVLQAAALFLSGWDDNDHPARYFLAQLPASNHGGMIKKRPRTMAEARSLLEPQAVKLARKQGLRFVRQGDVFAIETDATTKNLERHMRHRVRYQKWLTGNFNRAYCSCGDRHCYSYFQLRPPPGEAPKGVLHEHYMHVVPDHEDRAAYARKLQIHGTVHTATELITLKNDTQYARGQLVHQPLLGQPNRPRDHHNVVLDGGKWWLCVRNTVPQA